MLFRTVTNMPDQIQTNKQIHILYKQTYIINIQTHSKILWLAYERIFRLTDFEKSACLCTLDTQSISTNLAHFICDYTQCKDSRILQRIN